MQIHNSVPKVPRISTPFSPSSDRRPSSAMYESPCRGQLREFIFLKEEWRVRGTADHRYTISRCRAAEVYLRMCMYALRLDNSTPLPLPLQAICFLFLNISFSDRLEERVVYIRTAASSQKKHHALVIKFRYRYRQYAFIAPYRGQADSPGVHPCYRADTSFI